MDYDKKNLPKGEEPTTAGGGSLVGSEVNRNKRAAQWAVAPIEVAGEMRAVAKRLTAWADDLEKLMTPENSEVSENAERAADPVVAAFVPDRAPVVCGESAEDVKAAEPAEAPAAAETPATPAKTPAVPAEASAAPVKAPAARPTLAEVKTFLTKLCAAGYAPQVKALIASYGATNLSGVPAEALAELMDTAKQLGGEENAR